MRTRRLVTVALTAATAAFLLAPGTAHARGLGWVDRDGGSISVGAESRARTVAQPRTRTAASSGSSSGPVCSWERVPDGHIVNRRWASSGQEVVLYFKSCPGREREIVAVPAGSSPSGQTVSPTELRERALERLDLPSPTIVVNPAQPVVQIDTWLRAEGIGGTLSESASAGAVTATVSATPRRIVWDMGNGDRVTCSGAAATSTPASTTSSGCSYIYRNSSAGRPNDSYRVTATIEWDVGWSVEGAEGGGGLPGVTTSNSTSVRVAELQALND
jgi:hypothetical protein